MSNSLVNQILILLLKKQEDEKKAKEDKPDV